MTETRYAIEISVDISDLATADEADEIRDRIESALAEWKPTVTVDVREY
jgi:divalent metal cation (Fe/Co/Zn/Cd) transporter